MTPGLYAAAGLGLCALCAGGWATILHERLEASHADKKTISQERNYLRQLATDQQKEITQAREMARDFVEIDRRTAQSMRRIERSMGEIHTATLLAPDDGCLDRAVPDRLQLVEEAGTAAAESGVLDVRDTGDPGPAPDP